MHEHLIPHKHPTCTQEIINLQKCHTESGLWQLFGVCNEAKHALDVCFKRERTERRYANLQKGKERQAKWEATMAEMDGEEERLRQGIDRRHLGLATEPKADDATPLTPVPTEHAERLV